MAADREHLSELLAQLARYSYWRGESRQLTSGRMSDEYVDCRAALSRPEVLRNLAPVVYGLVRYPAAYIGGMTMGADPIAISASLYSTYRASAWWARSDSSGSDQKLGWFSVRKEPKQHGTKRRIEGSLLRGAAVAVVEDVVTTGASTIQAINACREFGLDVVQVIILVDRQEDNGLAKIEDAAQLKADVICSKKEIAALWAAAVFPAGVPL